MAYIGKQPTVGNFVKLDSIVTSATTTFNLLSGGVAYSPQSANHCIVSLNGVIQSPNTSFTISGSTIVFASALTSSDVIDFILILGDTLNVGVPSDATVGFSKITSNLITGATAETSIAGGDSILIYDDSASALRKMTRTNFVAGIGGTNTPAFMAYSSTTQSVSSGTETELTVYGTEVFDSDNKFNTTTGRFTPTVAGKYFVTASIYISATITGQSYIFISKNNSNASGSSAVAQLHYQEEATFRVNGIFDLDTDDYVSVYLYQSSGSSKTVGEGGLRAASFFGGYKLIGA